MIILSLNLSTFFLQLFRYNWMNVTDSRWLDDYMILLFNIILKPQQVEQLQQESQPYNSIRQEHQSYPTVISRYMQILFCGWIKICVIYCTNTKYKYVQIQNPQAGQPPNQPGDEQQHPSLGRPGPLRWRSKTNTQLHNYTII